MTTPLVVDLGPPPDWLDVEKAAAHYAQRTGGRVQFVGELCIDVGRGGKPMWSEHPVAAFWQERPERPEYSPYFGLVRRAGDLMICDASSIAVGLWRGMANLKTGEVLVSRFRHDFRSDSEGAFVDGGRDYGRAGGWTDHHRSVDLRVIGPTMEIERVVALP